MTPVDHAEARLRRLQELGSRGGLDDSMDELHTLTLHALHRKIAVKAQNRVGDKKAHESTFFEVQSWG